MKAATVATACGSGAVTVCRRISTATTHCARIVRAGGWGLGEKFWLRCVHRTWCNFWLEKNGRDPHPPTLTKIVTVLGKFARTRARWGLWPEAMFCTCCNAYHERNIWRKSLTCKRCGEWSCGLCECRGPWPLYERRHYCCTCKAYMDRVDQWMYRQGLSSASVSEFEEACSRASAAPQPPPALPPTQQKTSILSYFPPLSSTTSTQAERRHPG